MGDAISHKTPVVLNMFSAISHDVLLTFVHLDLGFARPQGAWKRTTFPINQGIVENLQTNAGYCYFALLEKRVQIQKMPASSRVLEASTLTFFGLVTKDCVRMTCLKKCLVIRLWEAIRWCAAYDCKAF